jgi:hypothetical protein
LPGFCAGFDDCAPIHRALTMMLYELVNHTRAVWA